MALDITVNGLMLAFIMLPQLAHAQADPAGAFSGMTAFIKGFANLPIFEWGYYIGTITLAIQGYRWKTGRIDLMQLGGWGLGICLVFFAPNIVQSIKVSSGGTV